MNKVTSINRGMFLREYCESQNFVRTPDGTSFAVGVLSTVVLPQLVLAAYGGVVILGALVAVATLGAVAGLLAYWYLSYRMPRCVDAEMKAQAPPGRDGRLKKVA